MLLDTAGCKMGESLPGAGNEVQSVKA